MNDLPCGHLRWALPVLLFLGACTTPAGTSPVASTRSGEVGVIASMAEQYAELDPTAREAELRTLSASVERRLMTLSGLEDELGGAAAADAAYTDLSRALVGDLQATARARSFGRFGASLPAADQPSIGGLMFGNFVVAGTGAGAIVASTNEVTPAAPANRTGAEENGSSKSSYTISATVNEAKIEAGSEMTVDGMTARLGAAVTVAPCPDANGQFTSTTKLSAAVSSAGGRTGSNLTIEVVIKGQIDDDARLVSFDVDTRTQSASFESGRGQFLDMSTGWTVRGGTRDNYRGMINRTGGEVTSQFIDQQRRWGTLTAMMMQDKAVEAAKQGWESGRCVSLKPTAQPGKRTGLKPKASLKLLAPPRSKVDGSPVGGTVTAAMSGTTSVDPSGSKVKADATFTVIAPGEKDMKSTVTLEARSKRGVAKADVVVDTKAGPYTASGKAGNISFSGSIADLTQPFTIKGEGGAKLTFSYAPSDDSGRKGRMTYTGTVGGYKLSGGGGYTIAGDEGDVLMLTQTSDACAAGPLGCIGGDASITLTPTG